MTTRKLLVSVACGIALLVCAAQGQAPATLMLVLMPLSLVAAGCAATALAWPERWERVVRAGHRVLGLLFVLTIVTAWANARDWVHLLWSVQYPLPGLLLGAGLLLVRVWPDDRRARPQLLRGNGATVALIGLLVLGALPVVLTLLPVEGRRIGRESGSVIAALMEVARHGFGGPVPALMQPEHADQIARGLGHPPRDVTVTMGATLLVAGHWLLFALLALVGRALPAGKPRWSFFCIAPLLLAPAIVMQLSGGSLRDMGIWNNEPWIVEAYGPTLVAAAASVLVLFLAVRRDERRSRPCALRSIARDHPRSSCLEPGL